MKKFELFFTFLQLPLDYLLLCLAGFTAYNLRFTELITSIRPVRFNLPWAEYWPIVLLVALGWIVIFIFSGLYHTNPNRKLSKDIARIITACSTGFAAITVYVFFSLQRFDSRFLVLTSFVLAMLYVIGGRLIIRGIKALLYRLKIGLRRVIIIGAQPISTVLENTFSSQPRLGYQLVGTYKHFTSSLIPTLLKDLPDEIIFTDPKAHEQEVIAAIDFANEHTITFKYSADLFSTISTNMTVSTITGIPIIELRRTRLTGWGRIVKRIADLVGSLILLCLSLPFFVIISLLILIETGRPVIYKNKRVGQKGKHFFTLKFRTMYQKDSTGEQFGKAGEKALQKEQELIKTSSIKSGPIYKIKNDPRITPLGRFLRRSSLDEIPQFINVLKGDMSLVGPRPHQPREVDKYEKAHKMILDIKPGITGLAQISGRSNLSYEEEIRLDTFYMENWNIFLDAIIVLKTPFIVLKKDGSIV
jgi:exopolysaccharide biosynthesis polyprenyl glycosylphosphotransferase